MAINGRKEDSKFSVTGDIACRRTAWENYPEREMRMNRKETALETFGKGFNCCQSVLSAFGEEGQIDRTTALKIAAGFGGGLRKGEVCGAVSGGVMVLGLHHGHFEEGDVVRKEKVNARTVAFIDSFEQRNGSCICKKLLGYDISVQSEHDEAAAKGVFGTVCPKMIGDAVELLEGML